MGQETGERTRLEMTPEERLAHSGAVPRGRRTPAIIGGVPAFKDTVFITRAMAPDESLFSERLRTVFESRWFTNDGKLVRELELRLAERLGVRFCATFCNGTVALQIALRALKLEGEVITTPFTFPATVHAIEWNGLTPVFCDVDPETYNLDIARAAAMVSSRTSALLPVHIFGNPNDVVAAKAVADRYRLKIVYDAAHAFGVSALGEPIGGFGDLSVLSFHATKMFHTAEGGAIVGSDHAAYAKLASLRNFGIVNEEIVSGVGLNGKLSEVHAAVGLSLLGRMDGEIERRRHLTRIYRERLEPTEGLCFQRFLPDTVQNHAYFTVEIDEEGFGLSRDQVHIALRSENIQARKYFHPLCSQNQSYRDLPSARPENLPNAHRLASRILCLPLYGELADSEVERIVDALLSLRAAAPRIRNLYRGARA